MTRRIMTGMLVLTAILVMAGCSGTGVTTRTYMEDKPRVDQDMSGGNYGYLYGQPVPENRDNYKKTRRVYVLEVTKEPEETADVEPIVVTRTKTVYVQPPAPQPTAKPPAWTKPIALPSFDEETTTEKAAPATGFKEYTVQKNDTLQKISKKFYDTYRKWPQIYEANKDKLKSPNKIKPGMTLRIPVE